MLGLSKARRVFESLLLCIVTMQCPDRQWQCKLVNLHWSLLIRRQISCALKNVDLFSYIIEILALDNLIVPSISCEVLACLIIVFLQFGLSPTWENSALARTPLAAGYSDAFWTWWHGKTSWWMMMGLLSYMKFSSGNLLLGSFKCLRFLRKIMWIWQVWAKAEISFWKQQYLKTKVPY